MASVQDNILMQLLEGTTPKQREIVSGPASRTAELLSKQKLREEAGPEQAILAQMGPDAGFDINEFIAQRQSDWDNDTTGGEGGFDSDTLQMLVDALDGEGVNALSAEDVSKAMLRKAPSPETASAYNALGPTEKMQVLEELVGADGLGDLEWAIGAVLGDTPNAGQRGPVQVGPTPVDKNNPSRLEDPLFQEAMALWIEKNGREPATDGEFQEIEDAVFQMQEQAYDHKNRP